MILLTGSTLQGGKYQIMRALGQGGFGITYEAEQIALHRRVAIKEFFMKEYCDRDSTTSHVSLGTSGGSKELVEKFRTKFVREAQMIAGLDNPHIIKIHDIFEENGTAYYVMPFLEGGSLADKVKQKGPMPEQEAIGYIKQIGEALDYLHKQNILHLDVKPSNVLLNAVGEAVLIDFGISKHYDEAGSQTSTTPVGISKGFAPIEQYHQGSVSMFSPATDIYALGATLFYLITGNVPPEAVELFNTESLTFIRTSRLQRAITCAMSPRRDDRPQSIASFLSQLFSSSIPVINQRPISASKDESTVFSPEPRKIGKRENTPQTAQPAPTYKKSGLSFGIIASIIGVVAVISLVLVPNTSTKGRLNQTSTNTRTNATQLGNTSNSSIIKIPNKCQLSGNIVINGKSIPIRFDVDFLNKSGNSYYSKTPLPLSISDISEYADYAEFLLTEKNPSRTIISNNALEGNTTAVYRCRLKKNGSVSGTGRNYKGQDFTFLLFIN